VLYVAVEVSGVTQLDNIAYVVFSQSSIIKMFTGDTLSPLGERIHVEGMKDPNDILACRHDRQLYVADCDYCIWRVSAYDQSHIKWLIVTGTLHINKLSLTSRGILVMSWQPPTLCEYNTVDAQRLREVQLPQFVKWLHHGVETSRGTFVVSHQGTSQDKKQFAVSGLFTVVV